MILANNENGDEVWMKVADRKSGVIRRELELPGNFRLSLLQSIGNVIINGIALVTLFTICLISLKNRPPLITLFTMFYNALNLR